MEFDPKEGESKYAELDSFADIRFHELSKLLHSFVAMSNRYGRLLCRITWILGHTPPQTSEDSAVRDLIADVFDFLYHSRRTTLSGALGIAYPLLRRAFESLSLMVLFMLEPEMAKKWASGKEIPNSEVRKRLGNNPMGEVEESLKELYKFFSTTTHPNRNGVPSRYLGEGNTFVLGSIGQPDLVLVLDFCIKYLDLWYWFAAAVANNYRELLSRTDRGLLKEYFEIQKEFANAKQWLIENYNRLLSDKNSTTLIPT